MLNLLVRKVTARLKWLNRAQIIRIQAAELIPRSSQGPSIQIPKLFVQQEKRVVTVTH
jgi:hypothetical protein